METWLRFDLNNIWILLHVPPNYGFIWQQLRGIELMLGPLPIQTKEQPRVDWHLWGKTRFYK